MKKWLGIFSWFRKPDESEQLPLSEEVTSASEGISPNLSNPSPASSRRGVADSFEQAAGYLSIRIHSADYLKGLQDEEFIYRTDLEGTVTLLVLDMPYSVENVLRSDTQRWDIPEESLFSFALENLRDNYKREIVKYDSTADQGMLSLSGQDSFLTSSVFMLDEWPAIHGRYGSIISMPDRYTFLVRPIADDITLEVALQVIIPFTFEHFESAAETEKVSENIYWWYEGKLEHVPYNIGYSRLNYVLPMELEDLIY
jgi:hypothetical protein